MVRDHVGKSVRLASVSGGTDVVSGFAGGVPTTPIWAGELSAPHLGVALAAYDMGLLDNANSACHVALMTSRGSDQEALALALDHAWRWSENRRGRAYQVLNALLICIAIMATAYAAALTADMHGVAGMISLLSGASLVGAYAESTRLRASATLADEAIKKIEERLATTLALESLRLVEREQPLYAASRLAWPWSVSKSLVSIGALVSLAGAIYTWVATP